MDRMTNDARRAAAAGWLAQASEQAQKDASMRENHDQLLDLARARARRLAAQLAPIFPVISAATKTAGGLDGWADAWGRQILSAGLSDTELLRGLKGVVQVAAAAGNPPLSFSLFLSACRPDSHLTGSDAEARNAHPLLLTRDLLKDQGWCDARDRAIAKLRAMGALSPKSSP